MAARHHHGGLLPRRFAEKLSRFYGPEGCRLPRKDRIALLQKELSSLEAEGVKPFDPRAAFFMVALLVESSDAEYAARAKARRVCYGRHLQSPYWRNLRWLALVAADGRCQNCGEALETFNCHHLDPSYGQLGFEELADVACWCRRCHADWHGVAA
jgi:hypothetical protein